jgi:hypothetical protein
MAKSIEGSVSTDKVMFGYQVPLINITGVTTSIRKMSKRLKVSKINFTSNTEEESFEFSIGLMSFDYPDLDETSNRIVEILQNI